MMLEPGVPLPPVGLFALALCAGGYLLRFSWLSTLVIGIPLYLAIYSVYPLLFYVKEARKSGMPYVTVPIHQSNFIWIVFGSVFRPVLEKCLPKSLYDRIYLFTWGWEVHDGGRVYKKFAVTQGGAKSFIMATCDHPEVTTIDSEIVAQVLTRINDFVIEAGTYKVLSIYGENVFTTAGAAWTNQRKIIASTINERLSRALFDETLRQSEGLLNEVFTGKGNSDAVAETNALFDMMKKITINVLNGVGMGRGVAWDDKQQDMPRPGYKYTFVQSARLVMDALAGPILLPSWVIHFYPSFMPGHQYLKNLGVAMKEYPQHTLHLVETESARIDMAKKDETSKSNVISLLLRASQDEGSLGDGKSLTVQEIVGNLFIFTAAGFETTANSLSFALMMMARYPEWQTWLFEEVDALTPSGDVGTAELDYVGVYPKARRIMAFLFEVLRHFPALPHVSKQTDVPQVIQTSTHTYRIPAKTIIRINAIALHQDPDVWRNLNIHREWDEQPSADDEQKFRPSRWLDEERPDTMFIPPKGAYIPWSMGPRICPGMKMAQVEFVAAMLMLLRQHRLEAVGRPGESPDDVAARLDALLAKRGPVMTLLITDLYDPKTDSDGLKLRLVKRR